MNVTLRTTALLLLAIATAGCGSSGTTKYIHPNADIAAIRKVAVLPFDNVTQERTASDKVQKLFQVELLSLDVFDVVEPGLVTKTLRASGVDSIDALGPADMKRIGEQLGVDGLFLGSVVDFEETRSGNAPAPQVTIQLRLVETQSGATIWSTSKTRSGVSTSTRLFGIGGQSLTETARDLIRAELSTLLK